MARSQRSIYQLIRDAQAAVSEFSARAPLALAWDLLQERDADGNPKGPLPYTDEALVALEEAYQRNRQDIGVVHHLAVAHHARAWDMELRQDPGAEAEWLCALNYWGKVKDSPEFWANLKDKFADSQPAPDPKQFDAVRRELLEDLLEVHINFIHFYCDQGQIDRAILHIDLIQHTEWPRALKEQLPDRIFKKMTGTITDARASGSYGPALLSLEHYLALYPDYLPALRLYVDVASEWMSKLSHRDQWDTIRELSDEAYPYALKLAKHPKLATDPLIKPSLIELAAAAVQHGLERGNRFGSTGNGEALSTDQHDKSMESYKLALPWGRLACPMTPPDSQLRSITAGCLNNRAILLSGECEDVYKDDSIDQKTKLQAIRGRCQEAKTDLEEAKGYDPNDETIAKNLEAFTQQLAEVETALERLSGRSFWGSLL